MRKEADSTKNSINSIGATSLCSASREAGTTTSGADSPASVPTSVSSEVELSVTLSSALTYATVPGVSTTVGSANR